jgi:hypothetical protein
LKPFLLQSLPIGGSLHRIIQKFRHRSSIAAVAHDNAAAITLNDELSGLLKDLPFELREDARLKGRDCEGQIESQFLLNAQPRILCFSFPPLEGLTPRVPAKTYTERNSVDFLSAQAPDDPFTAG